MYDYVDIHSHLNFKDFDQDREAVIAELQKEKIATITVGTDLASSKEAIALADKYENLYATIGLHPADNENEVFNASDYEDLAKHPKVVAVGECGLDYFRLEDESRKKVQKDYFEQQIEFAVKHKLPLMIHCRDAYPDCIDIIRSKQKEHGEAVRGNFHFFTSPVEIAKLCLDVGFTVSFTGPITFAKELAEVVKFVPLERIMVETDAPFAAPVPFRGKRNNPLYVKEMVKKVALIKGISEDEARKTLTSNAFYYFLNKTS